LSREPYHRVSRDDAVLANAQQKWRAHNVLLDVGISVNMAGQKFAETLLQKAYSQKMQEDSELIKVKKEELNTNQMENTIKKEPGAEQETEEKLFKITHPVADVQLAIAEREERERHLIADAVGPFSRVLSARQDLKIRRYLCGLPEKEIDSSVASANRTKVRTELMQLAYKLFKNNGQMNKCVAVE
jgi:zinc finger CCCH domain-containing protein 13